MKNYHLLIIVIILWLSVQTKATTDPNLPPKLPHGIHLIWYKDKVVAIDLRAATEISPNHFRLDGKLQVMTYEEALVYMMERWLKPFNMSDFSILSRCWQPLVPKINIIPAIVDPVEDKRLGIICYIIGKGKKHLYEHCSYLVDKEYKPCLCGTITDRGIVVDPNSICLRCTAERLRKDISND